MIKTVLCLICTAIGMLVLTPLGLLSALFGLLGFRRSMSWIAYRAAQGWARTLIAIIGCKVTVRGRENIPRKAGICFVSNHNGIVDILILLAYAGRPFGFIAKKELLRIPFLNMWIAVLGGLFIDRKNPRKAMKTINAGIARIRRGSNMVIFPEGSRSRGRGLMPFRPGALKLATVSESVIVPVALAGTYEVFEINYRAHAVPVNITFGAPIETAGLPATQRKQILADSIFDVIHKALTE